MTTIDHIEIFFVDDRNGWACARYDAEGNQIGGADYSHTRDAAIRGHVRQHGKRWRVDIFRKGTMQVLRSIPSAREVNEERLQNALARLDVVNDILAVETHPVERGNYKRQRGKLRSIIAECERKAARWARIDANTEAAQ